MGTDAASLRVRQSGALPPLNIRPIGQPLTTDAVRQRIEIELKPPPSAGADGLLNPLANIAGSDAKRVDIAALPKTSVTTSSHVYSFVHEDGRSASIELSEETARRPEGSTGSIRRDVELTGSLRVDVGAAASRLAVLLDPAAEAMVKDAIRNIKS